MPEATTFAQITRTRLAETGWEETYFALSALKGVIQSLPGYAGMEVLGRADRTLELTVIVRWVLEEQLEMFINSGETPQDVLKLMEPEPLSVEVEYLLELG